ncbi:site-specific integrase [uncultured Draconibacterium sp.]|uniref:site-specific integrase n=1 Tax=uncultured Draconibacterium sp. TaxID=1573823 RepID=UPI002AA77941|nr:site-specific integrase [uncultured Draconibacterium sp.]
MKTSHTFGVQFITRINKHERSIGKVYARITVDKARVEISLKKSIPLNDWNKGKGCAKGSNPNAKLLNTYLGQVQARLTECYRELQLKNELITPLLIKQHFWGDDPNKHTLKELIDYHDYSQFSKLSNGTIRNYGVTRRYIFAFLEKKLLTSDIYLSKIDFKFISDFDFFLRTVKPEDSNQPMGNNGLMKHMQRLRKILKLGIRLEWMQKNPFDAYELRFEKTERGFLTSLELEIIEKKKIKSERLEYIRDLFVFSCYTGLSYIDAINLPLSAMTIGIDGQIWISTHREKTKTPLKIPILPKALEIIEKYKTDPRSINRGKIFPLISNQKVNSFLKEIAVVCGLEKRLTFHLARHTFATTITLSNGVPIETVSKLLGHRSIATTQIYAKVLENKISDDMSRLKEKLSNNSKENKHGVG